jgi:hypothetical protein
MMMPAEKSPMPRHIVPMRSECYQNDVSQSDNSNERQHHENMLYSVPHIFEQFHFGEFDDKIRQSIVQYFPAIL